MRRQGLPLPQIALFTLGFVGLLFWYLHVSSLYPYFFMWDMDHVVTLDTLQLHHGDIPDHLNHPGFGLYLLLKLLTWLGHAVGMLSVLGMGELAQALDPYGSLVEYTEFIRGVSPWLAVAAIAAMWGGLNLLLRPGLVVSFLLLLLVGVSESLTYHAMLVRTDFYSFFYWALAFLALAAAVPVDALAPRRAGLFVGGLFMGLSFLTKVQSLFHLAALVGILFLFAELRGMKPFAREKLTRAHLLLSWANALVFLALLVLSMGVSLPAGVATFTTPADFKYTTGIVILFAALLFGNAGWLTFESRHKNPTAPRFLGWLGIISGGFFAAFVLHFLIFRSPTAAWNYLLYDFRILFPRRSFYHGAQADRLEPVLLAFRHSPELLWTHLLLLVGFCWLRIRQNISTQLLLLVAALSAVALINIPLGTRANFAYLRDLLWIGPLLTLLNILYAALFWERGGFRSGRCLQAAGALLLIFVISAHGRQARHMVPRADADTRDYGWDTGASFRKVYDGNHPKFETLMSSRYPTPELRGVAFRSAQIQARRWRELNFVFPGFQVDHSNAGPLAVGLPVFQFSMDQRVERAPVELAGALAVDLGAVARNQKIGPEEKVPLLRRADLNVWLATDEAFAPLQCALRPALSDALVLRDGVSLAVREFAPDCFLSRADLLRYRILLLVARKAG